MIDATSLYLGSAGCLEGVAGEKSNPPRPPNTPSSSAGTGVCARATLIYCPKTNKMKKPAPKKKPPLPKAQQLPKGSATPPLQNQKQDARREKLWWQEMSRYIDLPYT